jgi:hypothetical protein
MDTLGSQRLRRFLLLFSLTANLGLLVSFMYANFFRESLEEALHVAACNRWWERVSLRMPAPVLGAAYVFALLLCMVSAPSVEKPFIYFQF